MPFYMCVSKSSSACFNFVVMLLFSAPSSGIEMDETKVRYNVNQTQPEHNVHVLRFHFASTSISFLCLHVMDFKGARIFVHSL